MLATNVPIGFPRKKELALLGNCSAFGVAVNISADHRASCDVMESTEQSY